MHFQSVSQMFLFFYICMQPKQKKQQCLTYYSFYTSYVIICPSICHLQPFKKFSRCCHFPAAKQNATCSDQSEIWVHLTTSKLVWSSGCFHLRQHCVVKWNTLDCWFQQFLKLLFCFSCHVFEGLSAIFMLFFYSADLLKAFCQVSAEILKWHKAADSLLVFPIGSSGFSRCEDKNVDFADFIDLIYCIVLYILYTTLLVV